MNIFIIEATVCTFVDPLQLVSFGYQATTILTIIENHGQL
jgi:hypothetical protein